MSDRVTPPTDRYVIDATEGARPISGTELVPARLRKYFTKPAFQLGALALFGLLVFAVVYFKSTNTRGDGKDSFWGPVENTINKMAQGSNPKVDAYQAKPKKEKILVTNSVDGVWSPSTLYFKSAESFTFTYLKGDFKVLWLKDAEAPEDPAIKLGPNDQYKSPKHITSPVFWAEGIENGPLIIEITPN